MYDCIIVLAHEMSKHGELEEESRSRISYACELLKRNKQSYLITPGWNYRKDSNLFIGDRMKQYAILHENIPSEKILVEFNSRDTVGDAFFSKINHIEKNNFKSILIVTSNYHVSRTKEIFNFVYGEEYKILVNGVKGYDNNEKINYENKSIIAFRNTFNGIQKGNNNQILQRLKKLHPFYNGKIHPAI